MHDTVIQVQDLYVSYGRHKVLAGVNLDVPAGSIYGFLGRNGTGKTTLIKTLLGLLKADSGSCQILGMDVAKEPLAIRRKVGYMAEDQRMYGWMRVEQIVRWVSRFYPNWDAKLTADLLDVLALPGKTKVKALSKGQNSKLALLLALGHRPQVVILDDPTLGLDPIARKEFLRYVIRLLQSNCVTVFFSSHLLYEIEPVADFVAILDAGKIIKAQKTHQLREDVRRLILSGAGVVNWNGTPDVLDVTVDGDRLAVTVENYPQAKERICRASGGTLVREVPLNLDEIFEAYVIGNRGKRIQL
jgi:ABC-2 type transport system ATP-binding protein